MWRLRRLVPLLDGLALAVRWQSARVSTPAARHDSVSAARLPQPWRKATARALFCRAWNYSSWLPTCPEHLHSFENERYIGPTQGVGTVDHSRAPSLLE